MFSAGGVKDICSTPAACRTSPSRQLSQSSLPLHQKSYILSTFCTEHNMQECLLHINQVAAFTHVHSYTYVPVIKT